MIEIHITEGPIEMEWTDEGLVPRTRPTDGVYHPLKGWRIEMGIDPPDTKYED